MEEANDGGVSNLVIFKKFFFLFKLGNKTILFVGCQI